jgi:hypothetical protein
MLLLQGTLVQLTVIKAEILEGKDHAEGITTYLMLLLSLLLLLLQALLGLLLGLLKMLG